MTVVLAIAVVVLAAGLIYALVSRREEPPGGARPRARRSRRPPRRRSTDLLRVNEESRKVDAKVAEATLDKRQAEIKALAERIAKGQEKIEAEVRQRGETDLQTHPCSSRWARRSATSTPRPPA